MPSTHPIRAKIEQNVLDAMQDGEEIWGVMPIVDYLAMHRGFIADSASRISNVKQDLLQGRWDDEETKGEETAIPERVIFEVYQAINKLHAILWAHDENLSRKFADNIELGQSPESVVVRKFLARTT